MAQLDPKVIKKSVALLNKHREKMSEEKVIKTLCEKYKYNEADVRRELFNTDLYWGI